MFKKSEEHEWTRFRGALSKEREDASATEPAEATGSTPSASASTAGPSAGPSFRSSAGDVNVGLLNTRTPRSVADGADVESLIGERTSFEGTLKSDGSVRIVGSVQGEIESKNTIIVEEKARVTARLTAGHVTIAGQVDGQIYCEGRVEIRPTGHVTGEISAGALIVQEGAYFDGNSKMATPSSGAASRPAAAAAQPAAAAASA